MYVAMDLQDLSLSLFSIKPFSCSLYGFQMLILMISRTPDRVTNQLDENQTASNALPSIETILQRIGTDVSKEHETGRVAKWFTEPMFGTARVHWLVSCAYIACPLSSLLVLVVATEPGLR